MGNGAGAHLERTAEVFWTTGATAAAVMEAMMNEATVETRLVGARKVHRRINTAGPQVRRPSGRLWISKWRGESVQRHFEPSNRPLNEGVFAISAPAPSGNTLL
jgi:hypothetical protein